MDEIPASHGYNFLSSIPNGLSVREERDLQLSLSLSRSLQKAARHPTLPQFPLQLPLAMKSPLICGLPVLLHLALGCSSGNFATAKKSDSRSKIHQLHMIWPWRTTSGRGDHDDRSRSLTGTNTVSVGGSGKRRTAMVWSKVIFTEGE